MAETGVDALIAALDTEDARERRAASQSLIAAREAAAASAAALKAHLLGDGAQPEESAEERLFRTKIGPFLKAIDEAGGAVTPEEFAALGRSFGYDPRGLGGFAMGTNPSIRSAGDRHVLTERGRALAAQWQAQFTTRIRAVAELLAALPVGSPEAEQLRRLIKSLAAPWRDYVLAATPEPKGDSIDRDFAAASLGTDQGGLDRLAEWGMLTRCRVNRGLIFLRREVDGLKRDRTWWRGLLELEP